MKSITTAIALLALVVSINSAEAKGKAKSGGGGGSSSKTPPAKKDKDKNPADAYMKLHDANNNGSIEPGEFQGSKDEFTKWDKNLDGKLDHGELTAMLKK